MAAASIHADATEQSLRPYAAFQAGDYTFPIGTKTYVMGILNITPDSFSDGGKWDSVEKAVLKALEMEKAGADIIDVGGESSRPGYRPVAAEEETARVIHVIKELRQTLKIPISIDTWKSTVASKAVAAGASIINDVWGCLRDPEIADVAYRTGSGLVLMYNAKDPSIYAPLEDVVHSAAGFLSRSIDTARKAGVPNRSILIDPGLGFGMDAEDSLRLVRNIPAFLPLGYPLLLGPSRKRFIGAVLDKPTQDRTPGTVAVCCTAACLGADFVRVHDVYETAQALKMVDAIIRDRSREG